MMDSHGRDVAQGTPDIPNNPIGKRFDCTAPGCGRSFTRKEHLTRHAKSHSTRPQYQCPLCGKRYARSDVLKRHVEFHPQNTRAKRDVPACVFCHDEKIKCDGNTPCQTCTQHGVACVPVGQIPSDSSPNALQESSAQTLEAAKGVGLVDVALGTRQPTPPQHVANIGDSGLLWVDTNDRHRHQQWFQAQFDWPSPTNLFMSSLDISTQQQPPGLFSSTTGANLGSAPPFSDSHSYLCDQVREDFSVATLDSVSQSLSSTTSTPTTLHNHSTPATSSIESDVIPSQYQTLHSMLQKDKQATLDLVQIFFREIHPYWPILHAPTFDISSASDLLLGSMLALASWATSREEHKYVVPVLFQELMAATDVDVTPSFHTLQAMLLFVVYAIYNMNEGTIGKACRANAVLHLTCRCLGIFNGSHTLPDRLQDRAFTFWLAKEQLHRLAYAVLRVDTYLSVLLNAPPSVRYQELCVPLLKSPRLWAAQNEGDRRRIQWAEPSGREKALFSWLMRDALLLYDGTNEKQPCLPYILHALDYHLGLCALQSGIWEATVEAHSFGTDEIVTKLTPGSPLKTWRVHLDGWKERMENDCAVEERFYGYYYHSSATSQDEEEEKAITPITLLLWHMSKIRMHAPLSQLRLHSSIRSKQQQYYSCGAKPGVHEQADIAKVSARLRVWFQSDCSRRAVYSAAQIVRVLERENGCLELREKPVPLKNPLAAAALLMSAIVVCSYASGTKACDQCNPDGGFGMGSCVALFATDGTTESRLLQWVKDGQGWAIWCPTGALLCQCGLEKLGRLFSGALAIDKVAKEEFDQFFQGLVE